MLQIIGIQEHLQQAITKVGLDTSKYTYVYQYILNNSGDSWENSENPQNENSDIPWNSQEYDKKETKLLSVEAALARGIDSVYFKAMLIQYVDEDRVNNSCIKGGMSGIQTFMSSFMSKGEDIDIIISYSVKIPVPILHIKEIPFLQRVRIRGFHGYTPEKNNIGNNEEEEQEETYVYVTETGRVYHLSKECSHLKLNIEEIGYNAIDNLRNDSGGKYYTCSLCIYESEKDKYDYVYITKFGDRYHSSLSCSGLKRTILTIGLDQIGDKTLCTRCGNTDADIREE